MQRKSAYILGVLIASLMVLTSIPTIVSNAANVEQEIIFTIAYPGDIDQQNVMQAANHRDIFVLNTLIHDTLTVYKWDGTQYVISPWLAESWESNAEGTKWTFNLVQNAKWHDGMPLTSDDVRFTIDYCVDNDIPLYKDDLSKITSIETPDDFTIILNLDEPFVWLLTTFTGAGHGGVPIIPKHIWTDKAPDWQPDDPATELIGSGPFKWVERIPGEWIEVEKNDDYWQEGKPYVDRIQIPIIGTAEARYMAMSTGDADTERYETAPTLLKQVAQNPDLELVVSAGIWDQYLGLNLRREPMNDIRLRKAIATAMDHDEIAEKVMLGWGDWSYSILYPSWHGQLYNDNVEKYPYNIEVANQMLDDAGYADNDGDGWRDELDGLEFLTLSWFPLHFKAANVIVEQMKRVGIRLELKALDSAAYYGNVFDTRDFDLYIMAGGLNPAIKDQVQRFHSELDVTPGAATSNHWGIRNDTLDGLIDTLRTEKTESDAVDTIHEIQYIVSDQLPMIPTFLGAETHVIRKEWTGYEGEGTSPGNMLYIHNRFTPINIRPKGTETVEPVTKTIVTTEAGEEITKTVAVDELPLMVTSISVFTSISVIVTTVYRKKRDLR